MKKYIEIPDVVNIPDAEAAKQAWDIHRKRNNSIIIDLFYVRDLTQTCIKFFSVVHKL